jgi:hypothetical protein
MATCQRIKGGNSILQVIISGTLGGLTNLIINIYYNTEHFNFNNKIYIIYVGILSVGKSTIFKLALLQGSHSFVSKPGCGK